MERRKFVVLTLLSLAVIPGVGCGPKPGPDGGPLVTPTSWTEEARNVTRIVSWALPATRAVFTGVIAPLLPASAQPAVAVVIRALDVAEQSLAGFIAGLDQYDQHGEACRLQGVTRLFLESLLGVAEALAGVGYAVAVEIARVLTPLGQILDVVEGRCPYVDAGWTSESSRARARLGAIEAEARARTGAELRPFPTLPRPVMDAGVRP